MNANAAYAVLIALAECVRDFSTPDGMVPIVFHYKSCVAVALARSLDPLAADIAATLQLGPARDASDAWHCWVAEGRSLSTILDAPTADWVLGSDPDAVRFLLINASDEAHALGVNRFGPPSVFAPVFP